MNLKQVKSGKMLVLYYSYGGNTRSIARRIQEALGCDTSEIQTVTPYTGAYEAVVEQGQREVSEGCEPPVRPMERDPADYDTIILGTPVWWYTFAPAVKSVLSAVDWTGKTVYPFATNGGWIGHTFKDLEKACAGGTVEQGLNLRFDEDRLCTDPADLDRWIARIKGA